MAVLLPINIRHPEWPRIRAIASLIRRGAVVATPTDTVYGLAANPFDRRAVRHIFRLKKRPQTKPILLLIDSPHRIESLTRDLPPAFERLALEFWPGPLTLILPASPSVPEIITAGSGSVAVRCPASPFIRMLSRSLKLPLTGTSANRSGLPPALEPREATRQFGERLCYVVDGGRSVDRRVSTIVDLTGEPRIVRAGAIPAEILEPFLR